MDENLFKIFARLNFHQILLEVIQANEIARNGNPELALENFREDLLKALESVDSDNETEQTIRIEIRAIAESYLDSLESQVDQVLMRMG